MKHLAAVIVALALTTSVVLAQPPALNFVPMTGSQAGVGARAAALGGAYTAVADDAYAVFYNPAGLNQIKNGDFKFSAGLVGSADGINLDDLQWVIDTISNGDSDIADLEDLWDFADGTDGLVTAEGSGFLGGAIHNIGLAYYGVGTGSSYFSNGVNTGQVSPEENGFVHSVAADASAIWAVSYAAALAQRIGPDLAAGVTLRSTEVTSRSRTFYAAFDSYSSQVSTQRWMANDRQLAADLGLMYWPEEQVTMGLMIRNLNSPEYEIIRGTSFYQFTAKPCVDFGMAARSKDGKQLFTVDVRNMFGENLVGATVGGGYEGWVSDNLCVRLGGSNLGLTGGLGVNVGFLTLNAYVGLRPLEQWGLSADMTF